MSTLYYYTARDMSGAFVRGSIQAGTASAALASLRTRALYVTSLENARSTAGTVAAALQIGGVSQKSIVTFFRSFSTLIRSGVPMRRSLEVTIEECGDSRLREALRSVACEIENGLALSEAMSRHPREFPRLFVAMIRAGELGGVLDEVLERIAAAVERDRAARKRVSAALTYPAIVACAALGLILFLVTTIVPMFRSMYDQMHVPLPRATLGLITLGMALRSPMLWLTGAIAALCATLAVARLRSSQRGALVLESLLLCVPVAGTIVRKTTIARLARMLGTLLRSGVGLVQALEVITDVVTSARYRESIAELRRALREGANISQPLASSGLYEPMFVQMLRVGEETGTLDAMLLRIADYYDLDTETMLSALGSMLEPAMILLLGGAVGFIVAAVFIPLYSQGVTEAAPGHGGEPPVALRRAGGQTRPAGREAAPVRGTCRNQAWVARVYNHAKETHPSKMDPTIALKHFQNLASLGARRKQLEEAAEKLTADANARAEYTARKYEEIGRDIARGSRIASKPRRSL